MHTYRLTLCSPTRQLLLAAVRPVVANTTALVYLSANDLPFFTPSEVVDRGSPASSGSKSNNINKSIHWASPVVSDHMEITPRPPSPTPSPPLAVRGNELVKKDVPKKRSKKEANIRKKAGVTTSPVSGFYKFHCVF